MELTFKDFVNDLQHFVVRGSTVQKIHEHIEKHYSHISLECIQKVKTVFKRGE